MCLTKLNWYLLLTKGSYHNSTVKKEDEEVVSLLIIFYAMTLYYNVCTHMRVHCIILKC